MASLPFVFGAAASGRVFVATATKGVGPTNEKSFVDWLLGSLTKEDQFFETNPILQKVEGKSGTTTTGITTNGRKGMVSVQSKKNDGNGGGFGGLFAKKQ